MGGVFISAMLPFLFSALAVSAVGRAAKQMNIEVGRQFRKIKGVREGTAKAEYSKCVKISTRTAIKEMLVPGLMAVIIPVVIGFLSKEMLAGVTVSSVFRQFSSLIQVERGINAKKLIEGGLKLKDLLMLRVRRPIKLQL